MLQLCAPRHLRGNIQALSAPDGFQLWVSAVEPGSTHDLTAALVLTLFEHSRLT
jgi:hypothetical protein